MSLLDKILGEQAAMNVPGEAEDMAVADSESWYRRTQKTRPSPRPSKAAGLWDYNQVDIRPESSESYSAELSDMDDPDEAQTITVRQEDVSTRIDDIFGAVFGA